MTQPFLCPNCKGNRTRFNFIEQQARPVKLDSSTGDILDDYREEAFSDPMHNTYKGADYLVQCGICGNIAGETTFIKTAQVYPPGSVIR